MTTRLIQVLIFPLLLIIAATGCGSRGVPGPGAEGDAQPAMRLEGQRVLVLPVQAAGTDAALPREQATAELLFALSERSPATTWVAPAVLERALARSPGYAADPAALPADPLLHHGERHAADPLASELRRYTALADTRLVLLPRRLAVAGAGADTLELEAAVLDSRTGAVLWLGSGRAPYAPSAVAAALRQVAASLAERLLASPEGAA